ncbi:hypothetical protein [Fructobacillus americanaquae]|uniref:Uncharacterized protein n=1 Tax=Fructobacillus americanaquae TaxID=2940302 RepID=A0ABY5BY73_9LACO|nr:hypothetical protein [Fructobacillus americanaquae]USS91464.1 hypothetical protein M3M36_03700 [Fructobacillus americanaquae]
MDQIIEVTQNLLQKQGRNKKNFVYLQIPIVVCIVVWDILVVLLLISMVKHNMIDTLFVYNTLLLIMLNYLAISSIKRFNRLNSAVQYHVIPKIIDINNFDSTNNWLKQNKHLFPKTIIGRLFSNRMNYCVWGCIETNDNYQVVIIDLSKKIH